MPKYYMVTEIITEVNDGVEEVVETNELPERFRAPTLFCSCPMGKRNSSFTRGQKYGWWVHTDCGKPTKLWGSSPGAVISATDYHMKERAERLAREEKLTLENQERAVI